MGQADTPWGAQDIIMATDVALDGGNENIALQRMQLDTEELTPVVRSRQANTIIYVLHGAIDLKVDDEFYELEDNEAHYIEHGTAYQIENLDDDVTAVLKITVPHDNDDLDVLENPYDTEG